MPTRLSELSIDEISLVDRPAEPNAKVAIFKREIVAKDEETPYPKQRLSKDKEINMPDNDDEVTLEKAQEDLEAATELLEESTEELTKAQDEIKTLTEKVEELEKALHTHSRKADDEDEDEEDLFEKADPALKEAFEKQEAALAEAKAEASEATTLAKAERDARLEREFIEKADSLPQINESKDELGKFLKRASDGLSDEDFEKLDELLKAANEQISKGKLFAEVGSGGGFVTGSSEDKLDQLAKSLEKKEGISYEAAYDRVMTENPEFAEEAVTGEGA